MIKLENLTKNYGHAVAVDNICFEIKRGQIVGFLGPNGAGKTTTMRMLTGYLSPTSGKATVSGYDIVENSIAIRKIVGYLAENNPVYEDMTVPEYLEFVAEIRKYSPEKIKSRIREVIEMCSLKDVLEKNIGELSRGYRQRVGFAAAIFHDPDVLILDEPTSGLDPNQTRDVRNLIGTLKKEKTVIISTHILSEVQAVCDRVLIINRGRIVADGTTNELQNMVQGQEITCLEIICPGTTDSVISESLKAIQSCTSVTLNKKSANIYHFNIESSSDIREKIFDLAVSRKWKITEMYRQTVSLEEVFKQLTENK